jgi:hypothetical protein
MPLMEPSVFSMAFRSRDRKQQSNHPWPGTDRQPPIVGCVDITER